MRCQGSLAEAFPRPCRGPLGWIGYADGTRAARAHAHDLVGDAVLEALTRPAARLGTLDAALGVLGAVLRYRLGP